MDGSGENQNNPGAPPPPQGNNNNNNGVGGGAPGEDSMMNLNAMRGPPGGGGMAMPMGMMPNMGMPMGMAGMMNPYHAMQAPTGDGNELGATGFVPELDMMALLRAKQKLNMMNRPDQKMFGMGRPEDLQVSSAMIDKLKRSGDDHGDDDDEPKGKKRRKAKKPNDMPRRALSAYNIFFSEQREVILKEIEAKDKAQKMKDEGKTDAEIEAALKADEEAAEAEKKEAEKKEGEDGGDGPSVMNRTFFPTRAKRAHRKVHGKIGLVSLAREVSARWKALSPEKRKHYQDLAEQDRERHKKVMADYQERKAAENMISMGSPSQDGQEAPNNPPAASLGAAANDQESRDVMAQQFQQRILAEMMARQQQNQQMMGMMPGMMGQNFGMGHQHQTTDPSLFMQNPAQAQMWRQMNGMGPM